MDYYPDLESNTISDKLDVLVRALDGAAIVSTAINHPGLKPDTHGYTLGKKYARVFYDMSNGQQVVAFFVQVDNGNVWKAAGWKSPALNFVRGNIWTSEGRRALITEKTSRSWFYAGF